MRQAYRWIECFFLEGSVMKRYLAVVLLFAGIVGSSRSISADCTFSSLVATRDSSGAKLTANPSLDQCDSAPTTLKLQVFNLYNTNAPSRILTYTQVTYVSGPRAISVDGKSKSAGAVIAKAFIQDNVSIKFASEGDYQLKVTAGGGGPAASSQTFQVKISHLELSPSQLDIATGGVADSANTLNVDSGLSGKRTFKSSLRSNRGGESAAKISIDAQGRVTAVKYRQSGIYDVTASLLIFSRSATITVPPQPLIQVLIGEAQAQSENGKAAVAGVIRNRLNKRLFGNRETYNDLIFDRSQFTSTKEARFINAQSRNTTQSTAAYDSAFRAASKVFDGRLGVPFGNVIAYGSPGASNLHGKAEVRKIQAELDRSPCRKVSATKLGFDEGDYWYPDLPSIKDQQVVIFSEVPLKDFAFIRERPSGGCGVVQQSWKGK
jgi:hypothetical protein